MNETSGAEPPKRQIGELETEAMLGRSRILIVEGPTDREFFQTWATESGYRLVVMEVEELDLTDCYPGGEWGNRDKVAMVANRLGSAEAVRCLVDRDLDGPESVAPLPLLLTDFPGLESYVLCTRVISRFVRLADGPAAPASDPREASESRARMIRSAVHRLATWLLPLYRIRTMHRNARSEHPFPRDFKKYRLKAAKNEPDWEKLCREVGVDHAKLDASVELASIDKAEAIRDYAYGHDIAPVMMALWPDLRQRVGISTPKQLEHVLLGYLTNTDLDGLPLFQAIVGWIKSDD